MNPKKPAKKRPAAKRKALTPQVNRMPDTKPEDPTKADESTGSDQVEETQEDRDAAAAARREKVLTAGEPDAPEDYEPKRQELENKDFDHHGAHEKRQAELQRERDEHNARTGDASLSSADRGRTKGTWN